MNGNGSSIEFDMHSLLFILIVVKGDFREEVYVLELIIKGIDVYGKAVQFSTVVNGEG